MKKYKRKTSFLGYYLYIIIFICFSIITLAVYLSKGTNYPLFIISLVLTIVSFIGVFSEILANGFKFQLKNNCIEILYFFIPYKKIDYIKYNAIVISNASYNNQIGYGIFDTQNIPMQYIIKNGNKSKKITFPFITMLEPTFPIHKLKDKMNSRDLPLSISQDCYSLGICWFEALSELLEHTDYKVYILEDVYMRFKGILDNTFSKYDTSRFFIVSNDIVSYNFYL